MLKDMWFFHCNTDRRTCRDSDQRVSKNRQANFRRYQFFIYDIVNFYARFFNSFFGRGQYNGNHCSNRLCAASDVVVLEDDKNFYPSYICGNVIRAEVLRKYPELEAVFEKMNGFITDSDMAAMNYEVETDSQADRYYRVVRYPRYFRGIEARHKSSRYE